MKPLYALTNDLINLNSILEKIDDEELDCESINSLVSAISSDIQTKCVGIGVVIKTADHFISALKAEEDALKLRRKCAEAKIEHLKNYLLVNMQQCNINVIDDPKAKITLRNNPSKVNILCEASLAPEYWREKVVREIDKLKIKDILKSGTEINGACLINEQSVIIK